MSKKQNRNRNSCPITFDMCLRRAVNKPFRSLASFCSFGSFNISVLGARSAWLGIQSGGSGLQFHYPATGCARCNFDDDRDDDGGGNDDGGSDDSGGGDGGDDLYIMLMLRLFVCLSRFVIIHFPPNFLKFFIFSSSKFSKFFP